MACAVNKLIGFVFILISLLLTTNFANAQQTIGKSSGLPVPRFVSLKVDKVNLREGPSKDHKTNWIFQRAGLPVEITAEFDIWRKVRDSEGTEGWVQHALLSARRTVLISPWTKPSDKITSFALYSKDSDNANMVANLQAGVIANVKSCNKLWCHIYGDGFDGYIQQTKLWGVYPDEIINPD